jgi:hypothetical protein
MSAADVLMSVRLVLAADQPAAAGALALGPGRLGATVAGLLGLVGVVAGGLALARRDGAPGAGRRRGTAALAAGLVAVALGALVVVTAEGGVGTGNGLGGGVVAVVVGVAAVVLGVLARARSRRAGAPVRGRPA